jgi:phosphoribosylformylglycinamidine synthase
VSGRDALGGSAYWAESLGFVGGQPPAVDLAAEKALQQLLAAAAREHLLHSAHDCSTGGLAVALAESAIGGPYQDGGFGATVDLALHADQAVPDDALLFGESGARAVVTVAPDREPELLALAGRSGVPAVAVGSVGNAGETFSVQRGRGLISRPINRLREIYFDAIPRRMAAVSGKR